MTSSVLYLKCGRFSDKNNPYRCTAPPNNIDGPGGRRTQEFTNSLIDELDSKTLWDEYGIDDDVVVSTLTDSYIMYYIENHLL